MNNDHIRKDNHEKWKNKGTFIVKVDGCERGTWHGKVVWAEENRSEHFRSTLELLKMIDDAIGQEQSQAEDESDPEIEVG